MVAAGTSRPKFRCEVVLECKEDDQREEGLYGAGRREEKFVLIERPSKVGNDDRGRPTRSLQRLRRRSLSGGCAGMSGEWRGRVHGVEVLAMFHTAPSAAV
jgi:hypothetical protein